MPKSTPGCLERSIRPARARPTRAGRVAATSDEISTTALTPDAATSPPHPPALSAGRFRRGRDHGHAAGRAFTTRAASRARSSAFRSYISAEARRRRCRPSRSSMSQSV